MAALHRSATIRLGRHPCRGRTAVDRGRSPALGASLTTIATLELLRALLPGLLLVRTDTGELPLAPAVAIAAAVVVGAPLATIVLARRHLRATWFGALVVIVAARTVLLAAPGGTALLLAAGTGTAAGLVALVVLTAAAGAGRAVRVGVLIGLAVEALVRIATLGEGLVWSTTPAATALTVALLIGLLAVAVRAAPGPTTAEPGQGAPAWTAAWLLPAIVLTLTLSSSGGRIAVATGWSQTEVALTAATAQVLGVLAALLAPRLAPGRVGPFAAGLLLIGTAASLPAAGWPGVLGPVAVAIGLGAIAGIESPQPRAGSPLLRVVVPAAALAGAGAILLLDTLAVHLALPGNTGPVLLLLSAVGGAALGLVAARPAHRRTVRAHLRPLPVVSALVVAGVAIGLVGLVSWQPDQPPAGGGPDPDHLTVASLAVRSGFGLDGRYDPPRQAEVLRAHEVDLVLLNGLPRGGWVTGGQDVLEVMARHLGLRHTAFAPAADEVTGNALLSRYPLTEFGVQALPGGERAAVHSQIAAVVLLPDGAELGVIGTQLATADAGARAPQARAVAGGVARLRERELPTVLLGDLGGPLEGSLRDSFSPLVDTAMPDGARTFPAGAPTQLRDHVALSPGLRRSEIAIPAVDVSTHLPVVVTVRRTTPS